MPVVTTPPASTVAGAQKSTRSPTKASPEAACRTAAYATIVFAGHSALTLPPDGGAAPSSGSRSIGGPTTTFDPSTASGAHRGTSLLSVEP